MFRNIPKINHRNANSIKSRTFSSTKLSPPFQYSANKIKSWRCMENKDGSLSIHNPYTNREVKIGSNCAENGCRCEIISFMGIQEIKRNPKMCKFNN
jgi:hypothetical protein